MPSIEYRKEELKYQFKQINEYIKNNRHYIAPELNLASNPQLRIDFEASHNEKPDARTMAPDGNDPKSPRYFLGNFPDEDPDRGDYVIKRGVQLDVYHLYRLEKRYRELSNESDINAERAFVRYRDEWQEHYRRLIGALVNEMEWEDGGSERREDARNILEEVIGPTIDNMKGRWN